MDETLLLVAEMTDGIWQGFRRDLSDLTAEEAHWRPLPQANSIAMIVRHLAIEAGWHQACLERGEPMPHDATPELQRAIDAVPLDFDVNLRTLEEAFTSFLSTLRTLTRPELQERSQAALQAWPTASPHQLGYHQAMHLAMHWGQIRTIRNLYRTTQGEQARFFPENPTYPKQQQ